MSRGRIIDKSFYTNDKLSDLSIEERYFYIATIIMADDEGRLKANIKYLKAIIFPFDSIHLDTILQWRNKLVNFGLLVLYLANKNEYLYHPNWKKWQPIRPDRSKPSDCPSPKSENSKILDGMSTTCQPNVNQVVDIPPPNLTKPNLTKPNLTKDLAGKNPAKSIKSKRQKKYTTEEFNIAKQHLMDNFKISGNEYPFTKADAGILSQLLGYGLPKTLALMNLFRSEPQEWTVKHIGRNLRGLRHELAKLLDNPRLAIYEAKLNPPITALPKIELKIMPPDIDHQQLKINALNQAEPLHGNP